MSEPNSEWTPIWSEDYKQHYYRRLVGGTWEITWQQPNPSQPDKTTSLHSPTTDPTAHGRSDSKFGLDSASIYHEANTGADNLDSTSGQHTPTAFSNDLIVNEPQHTRRPSQSTYSHTSAAYSSSEAYPQGPSQQPTSQYDHTHSSSNHLRQGFSNPAAPYQYPPQGGGPQYGNYFQHSNYPGHSNYPQHNNYSQHQHYKYPQPGNYTQLGNYSQASAYSQPGSYPQQDNYSQQNRGMYDTSLSTRPGHDRGQTSYTQHHTSARSEDSYGGSRGDEDLYIQNAGPPVATLNPYTLNESLDEAFSVKHRRFFQPGKVFSVLFTEAAGRQITHYNPAKSKINPHISHVRFGEPVYTDIRRFVVLKNRTEYCYACPIFTYSYRGTLKPGVRPSEHAIAHSAGTNAELLPGESGLKPVPMCVNMAPGEPSLHKASRIYFGIHHPIQYNVKVKDLGDVLPDLVSTLRGYWLEQIKELTSQDIDVTGNQVQ